MPSNLGEQLSEITIPGEGAAQDTGTAARLSTALLRIPVSVQVVIGTARLTLAQVAELGPGSLVTLEEKLGTSARVLVNGREVAKGDLFVLDSEGDRLGLSITEVAETGAKGP